MQGTWGWSTWGKRSRPRVVQSGGERDPLTAHSCFTGGDDGARLFPEVPGSRTGGDRHQLQEGKLQLEMGRSLIPIRAVHQVTRP